MFIHKPLEHYRELLKLFNVILSNTKSNQEEYPVISQIVHDLQVRIEATLAFILFFILYPIPD